MNSVIVTGATSFIGTHLVERLIKDNCEVYAIVRPNSSKLSRLPKNDKVHVVALDMNHYSELSSYIGKADAFYHLAWNGVRATYRDDEEIQKNNYQCSLEAMNQAIMLGCTFFLGSGSQAEYGSMPEYVNEEFDCQPTTEYGKYKLKTCKTLMKSAEEAQMKFIWTRIFSIYGKYDYPKTLIMSCMDRMKNNQPIEMTAGIQLWDYLYVKDAVKAMTRFTSSGCKSGIYNLASGEIKPLKDYVQEIKEVLRSSSELRFGAIPYGKDGPVNLRPDISRAISAGVIKNITPFKKGITEMLQ